MPTPDSDCICHLKIPTEYLATVTARLSLTRHSANEKRPAAVSCLQT